MFITDTGIVTAGTPVLTANITSMDDILVTNLGLIYIEGSTVINQTGGELFFNNGADASVYMTASFGSVFQLNSIVRTMIDNAGVIDSAGSILSVGSNSGVGAVAFFNTGSLSSVSSAFVLGGSFTGTLYLDNLGDILSRAAVVSSTNLQGTIDFLNGGRVMGWNIVDVTGGSFASDIKITNSGDMVADQEAFYLVGHEGSTTIINSGTITSGGPIVRADPDPEAPGGFTIVNTGTMTTGIALGFIALDLGGQTDLVSNSGLIAGSIKFNDGAAQFLNDGQLTGAVFASGQTYVTNRGTISGGVSVTNALLELENHGTIGAGVSATGAVAKLNNTGLINFDVIFSSATEVAIENSGVVTGAVFTSNGTDTVRNSGALNEGVLLNGGADFYWAMNGAFAEGVDGGAGNDIISGSWNDDQFYGGADDDEIYGRWGDDTAYGDDGLDTILGGRGDDTISGGGGGDELRGGRDDDSVSGDFGWDTIFGGSGDDFLDGGGGRDTLTGGNGNDTLVGGAAADEFVFSRNNGDDLLVDFEDGTDKLNMNALGIDRWVTLRDSGAIIDAGGDTLIDLSYVGGSGSVLMQGIAVGNVGFADFIF